MPPKVEGKRASASPIATGRRKAERCGICNGLDNVRGYTCGDFPARYRYGRMAASNWAPV